MPGGHLFVVLGDLTHVNCDAWMLPTDQEYSVTPHWDAVEGLIAGISRSKSEAFTSGEILAQPLNGWESSPLPVMTAVPLDGFKDAAELGPAIDQFIEVGARAARESKEARRSDSFAGGRPLPLLAMPSFGTDGGGGDLLRGAVLGVILDQAQKGARDHDVDLVLVLKDARTYALAQVLRKKDHVWEHHLTAELVDKAIDLAGYAKAGRLVPFMGAGVSMSAGAPSWKELITELAQEVGMNQSEVESLTMKDRNVLDQAAYLQAVYEDKGAAESAARTLAEEPDGGFGEAIARAVSRPRYGLAIALLASLKSPEAITLNYDQLFEMASDDVAVPRTVIPGGSHVSDSWLLKLHGSITDPKSIVLTRDDYLGFNANREALSAIVKATLITRHLLFVGFGLADDHFHQIVHDVKKAVPVERGREGFEMATALTLTADPLDQRLWKGQLALVPMGHTDDKVPASARTLEIFLDALLAHATDSHSYLLAPEFEHALSTSDLELKVRLVTFAEDLPPAVRDSASFPLVEALLSSLGSEVPLQN